MEKGYCSLRMENATVTFELQNAAVTLVWKMQLLH